MNDDNINGYIDRHSWEAVLGLLLKERHKEKQKKNRKKMADFNAEVFRRLALITYSFRRRLSLMTHRTS